jgi:hypothetical protein
MTRRLDFSSVEMTRRLDFSSVEMTRRLDFSSVEMTRRLDFSSVEMTRRLDFSSVEMTRRLDFSSVEMTRRLDFSSVEMTRRLDFSSVEMTRQQPDFSSVEIANDDRYNFLPKDLRKHFRNAVENAGRRNIVFVEGYDDEVIYTILYEEHFQFLKNVYCPNFRSFKKSSLIKMNL